MDVLDRADLPFPHSLPEFQRLFPDDAACAAYLEKARWGDCQRRSKSTPLAVVKMHHLMRFSPALAVVPVVHRRDPRCFV